MSSKTNDQVSKVGNAKDCETQFLTFWGQVRSRYLALHLEEPVWIISFTVILGVLEGHG